MTNEEWLIAHGFAYVGLGVWIRGGVRISLLYDCVVCRIYGEFDVTAFSATGDTAESAMRNAVAEIGSVHQRLLAVLEER